MIAEGQRWLRTDTQTLTGCQVTDSTGEVRTFWLVKFKGLRVETWVQIRLGGLGVGRCVCVCVYLDPGVVWGNSIACLFEWIQPIVKTKKSSSQNQN